MNNFLYHLFESSIYLGIFYGFYLIFFRNDIFFTRNRLYLLLSYLCALSLPSVDLALIDFSYTMQINPSVITDFIYTTNVSAPLLPAADRWLYTEIVFFSYLAISGLLFLMFLLRLSRLVFMIRQGNSEQHNGYHIITSRKIAQPFSFFNLIFSCRGFSKDDSASPIFLHEIGHIKYRHTFDILVAEMMKILLWFNPVVWLIRRSLAELHEYQADAFVLRQGVSREKYQKILIQNVIGTSRLLFVHPFQGDGIKRRLFMMQKYKNNPFLHTKMLVLIPVIFLLLFVHSGHTKDNLFRPPVFGAKVTSSFGMRLHPISKKLVHHNGIDLGAPMGTPVSAAAAGIVIQTGEEVGPGKYVLLQHKEGWCSYYTQMESISVTTDQRVGQGEQLGTLGSSGISTAPHLHFELHLNGEAVDPGIYVNFQSF